MPRRNGLKLDSLSSFRRGLFVYNLFISEKIR